MAESTTPEQQHADRVKAVEAKLVVIKFLVSQPPYCAGETAGFPPEVAERYLRARIRTSEGMKDVAERVAAGKKAVLGATAQA